jgi:hypothetical protein
MQKSRFYHAKPTLLQCKTIGFVKCWCIGGYAIVVSVKNVYSLVACSAYIIRYRGERVEARKSDFCLEGLSCGSDVLLVFHCLCILMAKFGLSPLWNIENSYCCVDFDIKTYYDFIYIYIFENLIEKSKHFGKIFFFILPVLELNVLFISLLENMVCFIFFIHLHVILILLIDDMLLLFFILFGCL